MLYAFYTRTGNAFGATEGTPSLQDAARWRAPTAGRRPDGSGRPAAPGVRAPRVADGSSKLALLPPLVRREYPDGGWMPPPGKTDGLLIQWREQWKKYRQMWQRYE